MIDKTKRVINSNKLTLILAICFFGLRFCEFLVGYFLGDRDGQIENPSIKLLLPRLHGTIFLILILVIIIDLFKKTTIYQRIINKILNANIDLLKQKIRLALINFNQKWLFDSLAPFIIVLFPLLLINFTININSGFEWYWELSKNIYQPQQIYYAESILLPLIAKIVGADQTLISYKTFSFLQNFIWLFFVFIFLRKNQLKQYQKVLVLLVITLNTITFSNFTTIGMPDPLTTFGAALLLFGSNGILILAGGIIGVLSHFSVTVFVLINVIFLRILSSEFSTNKEKIRFSIAALLSVLFGRLLLQLFYICFHYHIYSRISWVLEKGFTYWVTFNLEHWKDLFTLQNKFHLLILIAIAIIFIIYKNKTIYAMIFGILNSLISFCITVDRPRIFILIYWPVFIYSIIEVFSCNTIPKTTKKIFSVFVLLCICLQLIFM
jgi:hypothetical protein